jgi:predicted DNA-binding transcriptional regulator AlpA
VELEAQIREAMNAASPEDFPRLAGVLAQAQAELMARIVAPRPAAAVPVTGNLSAEDAAAKLGMSVHWLYREARRNRLPFAARLGRRVVCDAAGLERWRQRRVGRAA